MISHRGHGGKAPHILRLGRERNQYCLQRNMECPRAGLGVMKYPRTLPNAIKVHDKVQLGKMTGKYRIFSILIRTLFTVSKG